MFSEQKKGHLIKPFIICCPDGWIVDCYNFKALQNDSECLLEVLRMDENFRRICEAKKTTFVLDRGNTIFF